MLDITVICNIINYALARKNGGNTGKRCTEKLSEGFFTPWLPFDYILVPQAVNLRCGTVRTEGKVADF